ncbi:MAG: hypothetical protein ABI856_07280 [Nitrospira sp.]
MDEVALEGQKAVYGVLREEAHKALVSNQGRRFQTSGMVKQGVQSEVRHYHLGHGLAASVQNSVYVHLDFPLETLREAVEKVVF